MIRSRPTAKQLGIALLCLLPFPLAWGLYFPFDGGDDLPRTCAYRALTDLPCIFCGLTHAFAYVTHGQWIEAFRWHVFWPIPFCTLLAAAVGILVKPDLTERLTQRLLAHFRLILLAVVMGTIVRGCIVLALR